jgi:hypothetical protein
MASFFSQNPEPENPILERTPLQRTIDGVDSTSAAAPQLSFMLAGASGATRGCTVSAASISS